MIDTHGGAPPGMTQARISGADDRENADRVHLAIEGERRRLYSLFAQAPAAIAIMRGPDLVFELANSRYEEIVQRIDLLGKPLLEALPELKGQAILLVLERVYATGERFAGHEYPVKLVRTAGGEPEEVFFDFVFEPFCATDGTVQGISCLALDVTERVRGVRERERLLAEREVLHAEREQLLAREREARREAERALRAKDEFLAMLGHELRNPLAPIVTALQLLRLRGNDSGERERTVIEQQVNHLITLVDDMLDVARITQGKIELKRERIEISLIVARAIETASPLLEQRRQELIVDVPRHGVLVDADAIRLAQVLANLLTNAAKYTPVAGRITIAADVVAGQVVVSVTDSGIGIAAQTLPHVFEIFMQEYQASDRARGGLGLGLAIVQNLVQLHGGTVSAMSAGIGTGSTFTVRLPAAKAIEAALVQTEPKLAPRAPKKQGPQVLIVDDNTEAAEMLALLMNEFGCKTRVAYDGPSALSIVETFQPELALLDIGLPVMDGYELARHLRKRPELAQVHLVAITGYGQKSDIEKAMAAGFNEHITKPVDLGRLQAALSHVPTVRRAVAG